MWQRWFRIIFESAIEFHSSLRTFKDRTKEKSQWKWKCTFMWSTNEWLTKALLGGVSRFFFPKTNYAMFPTGIRCNLAKHFFVNWNYSKLLVTFLIFSNSWILCFSSKDWLIYKVRWDGNDKSCKELNTNSSYDLPSMSIKLLRNFSGV